MLHPPHIQDFNRLFNEYYDRFVRFASGYVKEKQIAEDFVSEAFTTYWENRDTLLADSKPQAYILTIVKNKCLNYLQHIRVRLRAEQRLSEHAEWRLTTQINNLQACDPNFLYSEEIRRILAKTLRKMPQKTRRIFVMNRYQGLSYKDIALRTNLSIKTIEFHISKALDQLHLSLKDFIYCLSTLFYFC